MKARRKETTLVFPIIFFFWACVYYLPAARLKSPEARAGFDEQREKTVNIDIVEQCEEGTLFIESEETIKKLKELEERIKSLIKERQTLEGDFYGINITAYRYVNVFYHMGYIRCRIAEIDKEIEKTKKEIDRHRNRR